MLQMQEIDERKEIIQGERPCSFVNIVLTVVIEITVMLALL